MAVCLFGVRDGKQHTYIKNLCVGYIIKAKFLSYAHFPDFFMLFTAAFS